MQNQSSAGFAAGTLVHTRNGLQPIESIGVGDWVLTQAGATDVPDYRQVLRTSRYQEQPVFVISVASAEGGRSSSILLVTGNQRVYVTGYDWGDMSEEYRSDEPDFVGWGRADELPTNMLLQVKDGSIGRVESADQIWRTSQADMGWIPAGPHGSEIGFLVKLSDGEMLHEACESEFMGESSFDFRTETEETKLEWAARRTVYNLDVEDVHSYFVGEIGVWVQDHSGQE
ncbi:MAG: hypothetical protein V4723_02395 [Pseudomonadota bacterium]